MADFAICRPFHIRNDNAQGLAITGAAWDLSRLAQRIF